MQEAERRGLSNITNMVDCIPYLVEDKSISLFERHKVLNRVELHSRSEIMYETYQAN